jgi:hypothetical protein
MKLLDEQATCADIYDLIKMSRNTDRSLMAKRLEEDTGRRGVKEKQ